LATSGGKWEDEEERRFFEDIQDLKDFVPKSVLGIEEGERLDKENTEEKEKEETEKVKEEVRKLEEELEHLNISGEPNALDNGRDVEGLDDDDEKNDADEYVSPVTSIAVSINT
jgi:regulator of nonsense transcripts 2